MTSFDDFLKATYAPQDILCSDRFSELDNGADRVFVKTDFFHTAEPVVWRGNVHNPSLNRAKVVLCGQSDLPLTPETVRKYPHVRHWFAINNLSENPRAITLPLGITNNTSESDLHRIYGNKDVMIRVRKDVPRSSDDLKDDSAASKRVYLNISVLTHPDRRRVVALLGRKPWVTTEQPVNTIEGREKFLTGLRQHRFCACPRGNGLDTHRLWESLYMGCIPIVEYNPAYERFRDLPILFVERWEDVTVELLDRTYEAFKRQTWNLDKLRVAYWHRLIEAVGALKVPSPLQAGPAFVLVHTGPPLPTYAWDCVRQLERSNPESPVYLVCDSRKLKLPNLPRTNFRNLEIVHVDHVPPTPLHEQFLQAKTKLDRRFRDGFFWLACRRLFVLYDFVEYLSYMTPRARDLIHIEYDNLVYFDARHVVRILRDQRIPMACPRLGAERMLANVLYVSDAVALRKLLAFFLTNDASNEMLQLGMFQKAFPRDLVALPISNPELAFDGIFDAAPIGQCIGGVDPRNKPGNTVGFVNEDSPWADLKPDWVQWKAHQPWFQSPTMKYPVPVYNLHIHCKDLVKFLKM